MSLKKHKGDVKKRNLHHHEFKRSAANLNVFFMLNQSDIYEPDDEVQNAKNHNLIFKRGFPFFTSALTSASYCHF